jgi:hypothetical protein
VAWRHCASEVETDYRKWIADVTSSTEEPRTQDKATADRFLAASTSYPQCAMKLLSATP